MMNPILSDKKNFSFFSQPPQIKSVDEVDCRFPISNYGCLSKVSGIVTGKQVLWEVKKVLQCHFADLYVRLNAMADNRKREGYSPAELVLGGVALFLLKKKSRNEMDKHFREQEFSDNYRKIFKLRCPSMCAVEDFYRILPSEEFDNLKSALIAILIEKRTLHSHRLLGKYFTIAVDATGVYSSQTRHWEECTCQTSKNGVVTWMNHVLEAKLVCSNGLSLSLCSEWIINGQEYIKQDCELKAFKRLAVRLKKYFSRLPVCLLFDGLYCNGPVMDICSENGWQWIAVFKEGNLPSIHQELELLPGGAFRKLERLIPHQKTQRKYYWCNDIDYEKRHVHWIMCLEEVTSEKGVIKKHHFEYLTNIPQKDETVEECVDAARDRWHIEDSFNEQKNRDFEMQHLFSRSSFTAFCNWYQSLQLAHMICQFVIRTQEFSQLLKRHTKQTIQHLWTNLCTVICSQNLKEFMDEFDSWITKPRQVRLC
jgi:hypothetical protein